MAAVLTGTARDLPSRLPTLAAENTRPEPTTIAVTSTLGDNVTRQRRHAATRIRSVSAKAAVLLLLYIRHRHGSGPSGKWRERRRRAYLRTCACEEGGRWPSAQRDAADSGTTRGQDVRTRDEARQGGPRTCPATPGRASVRPSRGRGARESQRHKLRTNRVRPRGRKGGIAH